MNREAEILDRLGAIGVERQECLERLLQLEAESLRLRSDLRVISEQAPSATQEAVNGQSSSRAKGAVSLPLGSPLTTQHCEALKAEVASMSDFDSDARPFIKKWYPQLAKTSCWHEINQALQTKFGKTRQQIAGVAAAIARNNGHEHRRAQA